MVSLEYTLDTLYEAELNFAAQYHIPDDFLAALQQVRRTMPISPTIEHNIAAWIVAPILAGFTRWLHERAQSQNAYLLSVMRDGRLLGQLLQVLFQVPTKEIWLNRNLSMLAAFGCGNKESLVNWLTRTRTQHITKAEAAQQLLKMNYTAPDASQNINADNIYDLLDNWQKQGWLDLASKRAQSLSDRMYRYWQQTVVEDNRLIGLMDFACAGNIQRSLQMVLTTHNAPYTLQGLNFVTTQGSVWAEKTGCKMQAFLAERGQPAWFAEAYGRTPEPIEMFTASTDGSLIDYSEDGQPVLGGSFLSASQKTLLQNLQKTIIDSATLYNQMLGDQLSADIGRCLWGRFLQAPMAAEVMALADWPLDSGLNGSKQRILAPCLTGDEDSWSKAQTAWPAGSRLRNTLT